MAEKKKTTTSSRKKPNTLGATAKMFGKFEVLFIVVLFLGFFAWAFSKCSSAESKPVVENPTASINYEDTGENASPAAANNPNSPSYDMGEASTATEPTVSAPTGGDVEVVSRNDRTQSDTKRSYTPLYVTLQDLKLRKGPSRDSAVVATLALHEEVMFMEKRTDFREKINIGTEFTNEPWVYVQTKKGQKGWVYGGGIHYFKWDRLKDPIPSISDGAEEEGI